LVLNVSMICRWELSIIVEKVLLIKYYNSKMCDIYTTLDVAVEYETQRQTKGVRRT